MIAALTGYSPSYVAKIIKEEDDLCAPRRSLCPEVLRSRCPNGIYDLGAPAFYDLVAPPVYDHSAPADFTISVPQISHTSDLVAPA